MTTLGALSYNLPSCLVPLESIVACKRRAITLPGPSEPLVPLGFVPKIRCAGSPVSEKRPSRRLGEYRSLPVRSGRARDYKTEASHLLAASGAFVLVKNDVFAGCAAGTLTITVSLKGGGVRGEENPNPSSGRFRGRIPRLPRGHSGRRSSGSPGRRGSSKRRDRGAGEAGKKLRPAPDHKQPARPH